MNFKGLFFGSAAAITYGLIPLFALPLLDGGMALHTLLCFKSFIAAIFMLFFIIFSRGALKVSKDEFFPLLILGLLTSLTAQLFFLGYEFMNPGLVATIFFVYPAMVAIIMAVFFKEKISLFVQFLILVAFLGVALIYYGKSHQATSLKGVMIVLASALTYSLSAITINKTKLNKTSGSKITFYSMVISGIYFLSLDVIDDAKVTIPNSFELVHLLFLGILCTAFSYVSLVKSVQYIGSTYTSILGVLEPVTAVIISVVFFKSVLTFNLVLGLALIFASVLSIILSDRISSRDKKIHRH